MTIAIETKSSNNVLENGKGNKARALKYFEEANKSRDFRAAAQDKIDRIKNPLKYQK